MLVHKYIIQNHPPSLSTNMYHGTILHSIHTAQSAPFPIQTLAKHYSHSPSPTSWKQWSHSPSPLSTNIPPTHCPSPTSGNLSTHSPSQLALSRPKLQWATDPTWVHLGGCCLHAPFWANGQVTPERPNFGGCNFITPHFGPIWGHLPILHFSLPSGLWTTPTPTNTILPLSNPLTAPRKPSQTQTMKLKNEFTSTPPPQPPPPQPPSPPHST